MNRIEYLNLRLRIVSQWKEKFKNRNISEVARLAGVSRLTIYNALNNKFLPNLKTINKIEEVLDEKSK